MKKIYLFIACLTTLILSTEAQKKSENVAGTKVSMIRPEGFSNGSGFNGFIKDDAAMINVMDLDGGNFYANARNFSIANFEAKGITVVEFKEITVDGYPGLYTELQADPNNVSINLIFGDSTFSAMIMSFFPDGDKKLKKEILHSINSISYDKGFSVDPFANASFTVDDSKGKLKFAKTAANLFIYSIDGSTETLGEDPYAMIIPIPYEAANSLKSNVESMIAGLESKGMTNIEIVSSSDENINGYKGYETTLKGTLNNNITNMIILSITDETNQLLIQGMQTGDSFDLSTIRDLIDTIKFK